MEGVGGRRRRGTLDPRERGLEGDAGEWWRRRRRVGRRPLLQSHPLLFTQSCSALLLASSLGPRLASSVGHGSLDEAFQQGKRRNSLLSHLRERKMTPAIAHTCPVSMRIDEQITCFHGNARKRFNLIGQSHPLFNPDGTKYIRCLKFRPMTKK